MPIKPTEKIWHNGKLIPWNQATLHVMSHVVNYGSSVFEGVRCYALPSGPGIFRAKEHAQRLLDSAKVYRIDVDFTVEDLVSGMVELVKTNRTSPCYLRPIILRGYGEVARDLPRVARDDAARPGSRRAEAAAVVRSSAPASPGRLSDLIGVRPHSVPSPSPLRPQAVPVWRDSLPET